MSRDHALQSTSPESQESHSDTDVMAPAFNFSGPWFDSRTAQAYVGCRTLKGWYEWRKRHAIVGSGRRVAKADLDRALKGRRFRRMAEASLANLQKRA